MKLTSESFENDSPIPPACAFCNADPDNHVTLGQNKNPALSWSEVPEGTKSLVLICHDPDVPGKPNNVNKEGKTLSAKLKRVDFFHWVLVDMPADAVGIQEGEFSDEVTPKGKDGPSGPRRTRQGVNDYTKWFEGDEDMGGSYFGYDGPCPPWNDSIVHHYHLTLYALDMERCPVGDQFTGADVLDAIDGHVLAEARITGTYSLNPDVPA
jgi:Raf kinase inhibitor-like YbhB/YbcL family protein